MTRGAFLASRALGFALCAVTGCSARACSPCEDTDAFSVVAPDGAHRAVASYRNCGATTSMALHLSIVEGNHSAPYDANALEMNCSYVQGCSVDGTVHVVWVSARQAIIHYPAGANLFLHEAVVGDVHIEYVGD